MQNVPLNEGRKYCKGEHSAILSTFIKPIQNQFSVFLRAAVLHRFYHIFFALDTGRNKTTNGFSDILYVPQETNLIYMYGYVGRKSVVGDQFRLSPASFSTATSKNTRIRTFCM